MSKASSQTQADQTTGVTRVEIISPIRVSNDSAADDMKAEEWLLDYSIDQMTRVGRILGVTGVLFVFSAVLSTLLNLGADAATTLKFLFIEADIQTEWPVQVLLFAVVVGAFAAMMYCFSIFASLTLAQSYLNEKGLPRARTLTSYTAWLEQNHASVDRQIKVYRAAIVTLSLAVLLVAAGTLVYSLI